MIPSQPATEPTPPPKAAAEGLTLWPWGIALVWVAAFVLWERGQTGCAIAALLLVAPWFVLQILPRGGSAFGRGCRCFETNQREIWLTIDDGPDPATTPRLLESLSARGMKATFFLIGQKARAHPALVARIVAEGHELGCHTEHHLVASFWSASGTRMRTELDACAAYLRTFAPVRYFRPPVGLKGPWLKGALRRSGLTLVLWSARGLDGLNRTPDRCLRRLISRTFPGGILLIHEVSRDPARSREYGEKVIRWLAESGYRTALPDPSVLGIATSWEE